MSLLEDALRKLRKEGEVIAIPAAKDLCQHVPQEGPRKPDAAVCQTCVETGDTWVHLRICLTCGYVGCCDNSKNKHATRHYRSSEHPVIKSYEPGEHWMWCYPERKLME